jgi:hypothetical protein
MLKRFINIAVSMTLVLLLMLNGVSHEFVHSFTGHEDTVDCIHQDQSGQHTSFEKAHHHCNFLELQAPVFLTSSISYYLYTPVQHSSSYVEGEFSSLSSEFGHTALRGPPTC